MKIVSRSRTWLLVSLATADFIVFGVSDPHSAPTLVLFIGFLLLAANFYALLLGLLKLTAWYGISPGRHRKRFIRLATGLFSGLVALQSIGELSSRDLLVLLPFLVVAYLYISYGSRSGHAEKAVAQGAARVPVS